MGPIYTIFFALHSSPICLFIGSVIFPQALTDHEAHELPSLRDMMKMPSGFMEMLYAVKRQ